MRLRDDFLVLGVAVSLVLTVALVVASTGRREPEERLARTPEAAEAEGAPRAAVEEPGLSATDSIAATRARAVFADDGDVGGPSESARRREDRRREAEFLAAFQTLRTDQGTEALERAVRDVLASRGEPLLRKAAGLRALHAAGVPGTDAVLAAAVEGQPDVSDGGSSSLPRRALKLLFERAPTLESARRVLARLAFVEEARVAADLRRVASTALAASIPGADPNEVVRLLRLETDAQQLARALEALSRDTNFGAARPAVAASGVSSGK